MDKHLLPEGFRDSLPSLAKKELGLINLFVDFFESNEYQIVKPPLIEFEKSLFFLTKNHKNLNSFRILDPLSQKMMGLRSDITSQIARIGISAFEKKQRPLRLCYFGEILKVKNDQLNISRQNTQIGAEIIGMKKEHEIEILNLIISFLKLSKVKNYYVIFSMPSIFESLVKDFELNNDDKQILKKNYSNKNLTGISDISKELNKISEVLLKCVGDFNQSSKVLSNYNFPNLTQIEVNKFIKSLNFLKKYIPEIKITIDPLEIDKIGYHNGLMYKFYSNKFIELFSGGCYLVENENCIGFSGVIENLIKESEFLLKKQKKIFIPKNEINFDRIKLQKKKLKLINAKKKIKKKLLESEAKKFGCQFLLFNKKIINIK